MVCCTPAARPRGDSVLASERSPSLCGVLRGRGHARRLVSRRGSLSAVADRGAPLPPCIAPHARAQFARPRGDSVLTSEPSPSLCGVSRGRGHARRLVSRRGSLSAVADRGAPLPPCIAPHARAQFARPRGDSVLTSEPSPSLCGMPRGLYTPACGRSLHRGFRQLSINRWTLWGRRMRGVWNWTREHIFLCAAITWVVCITACIVCITAVVCTWHVHFLKLMRLRAV